MDTVWQGAGTNGGTTTDTYTAWSGLENLLLEYSYVLRIAATPSQLTLVGDLVLGQGHPDYEPPGPGEQHCTRRGTLRFDRVVGLLWVGQGAAPATDETGEHDHGCIDTLTRAGDAFVLTGDFGHIEICSTAPTVHFDASPEKPQDMTTQSDTADTPPAALAQTAITATHDAWRELHRRIEPISQNLTIARGTCFRLGHTDLTNQLHEVGRLLTLVHDDIDTAWNVTGTVAQQIAAIPADAQYVTDDDDEPMNGVRFLHAAGQLIDALVDRLPPGDRTDMLIDDVEDNLQAPQFFLGNLVGHLTRHKVPITTDERDLIARMAHRREDEIDPARLDQLTVDPAPRPTA
ncbi:MAG: hypothetical protein WCA46_19745 [Actinocatenispora sp.]